MSFNRATTIKLVLLFALWSASACKGKPEAGPEEHKQRRAEEAQEVEAERALQPEKQAEGVLAAVPIEGLPPSAAQLPVPEDFQAETATTIMRANYLSELEKLETELQADEN